MDSSKMEHSYYQKEYSSSKWNTHIIKKELIMEHSYSKELSLKEYSYYQNEILTKRLREIGTLSFRVDTLLVGSAMCSFS